MMTLVEPPKPVVGAWVQRTDDGRIGRVCHVAVAGQPNWTGDPFRLADDVEVELGEGRSIVTNARGFWGKWKPVDFADLARQVVAIALGAG